MAGLDDERLQAVVDVAGTETSFDSLRDAIEWAGEHAERVGVRVDADGDLSPSDPRVPALVRRWALDQERFSAEHETRWDAPREWYVAFEEPDVEGDLEAAAVIVEQDAGVIRVVRGTTSDGRPLWFVDVMARTSEEAAGLAHDAVFRVAWPDERLDRDLPPGGAWAVSVSRGNQTVGLVEYRNARFFSPWPTT